jgi:hypothetical protein
VATTLLGATEDQPTQPTTPPADSPPAGDDSTVGLSAEEVESRWRHRVSQKDKAHAAAETALREENDRLKAQLASASRAPSNGQAGDGGGGNADYLREQLALKDREIEQERTLRAIEAKRAKYPALAKSVGESGSGIFGTADDATLARLNALAEDDDSTTFAPMTPRRAAPAKPKALTEMTKEELELELKRSVERGDHARR